MFGCSTWQETALQGCLGALDRVTQGEIFPLQIGQVANCLQFSEPLHHMNDQTQGMHMLGHSNEDNVIKKEPNYA